MIFYKSIQRKLRKLSTLSWRDQWGILQAWWALLRVDLMLRFMPFPQVRRWVARAWRQQPPSEDGVQRVIVTAQRWADMAARHHLYPMQCLRKTLVLQWLLNRQGVPTKLRFGVDKQGSDLIAHAWLEYAGVPLGEPMDVNEAFVPLERPQRR